MLIDRNNLHDVDTWMFFKWTFKTFVAVMILANTFNIALVVFDVSQHVIQQSAGIIQNGTEITPDVMDSLRTELEAMDVGPLLGLWLQSFLVQLTMIALNIVIFVIVYGRMIEIYLLTSLAPIPFATVSNRETGHVGQNYFRSLFAVGFQGFLIMVCIAIYAVLIQSIGPKYRRRLGRAAVFFGREGNDMATTTLLPRHTGEGETIAAAIRDCLDYGKNPEKTEGKHISAYECDPATVAEEFLLAKASYTFSL